MHSAHLEPTMAAARDFIARGITGPLVMLNLIRLREVADYSAHPQLAPAQPISGRAAYERYIAHTLPLLRASGGEILYLGAGGPWLIGSPEERWDIAMLVRQSSVQSFLAFADDPAIRAGLGHRSAAAEDTRLLPLADWPMPAHVPAGREP